MNAATLRRQFRAESATWVLIDQGFSSLSNFALSVLAARQLSADSFGRLSAVLGLYYVVLSLSRALASEPYVIFTRGGKSDDVSSMRAISLSASCVVGLFGSLMSLGLALIWSNARVELVVLGLTFPFLVLQDHCRYVLITATRARVAAAFDGFWVVAFGLFVGGFALFGTAVSPFAVWALAGTVSACAVLFYVRTKPQLHDTGPWRSMLKKVGFSFSLQQLLMGSWWQGVCVIGVAVLGVERGAGLRGAGVIASASFVAVNGLYLANLPKLAQVAMADRNAFRSRVRRLWLVSSLILGASGILTRLLPDRVGEQILGSTWIFARDFVMPVAAINLAFAFVGIGCAALRTLRASVLSLGVMVSGVTLVLLSAASVSLFSASQFSLIVVIAACVAGTVSALVTEARMSSGSHVALAVVGANTSSTPDTNHSTPHTNQ